MSEPADFADTEPVEDDSEPLQGPMATLVEAFLEKVPLNAREEISAQQARILADRIDRGAEGQNLILASRELSACISELGDTVESEGPRLGRLRGDEAKVLAGLLGHPAPDTVDEPLVDSVFALQVRRRWRLREWWPAVTLEERADVELGEVCGDG